MMNLRRRLLISAVSDVFKGGLKDSDGKYVFDNSDTLIVCADGAYQSQYTADTIDFFISYVLGEISDVLQATVGKYVYDSNNTPIVCSDGSFVSDFTSTQIDTLISEGIT